MALNPPLAADGTPLRVAGELFVLHRKKMEFEIKIENMGKLTGAGHVFFGLAQIIFKVSAYDSKNGFNKYRK